MNEEEKEQLKKEIIEELENYIDQKLSKIDNDISSIEEYMGEIESRVSKIRKILEDHDIRTEKYYW